MDIVSRRVRSRMMAAVPQKDSQPELVVRRLAHALGYRFRLHRRDLPGTPDVVFPRLGKAIFVHGCFWHRHGCKKTTTPATNRAFWDDKFATNRQRDRRVVRRLLALGWAVLVVWECQTKKQGWLTSRLDRFLRQ